MKGKITHKTSARPTVIKGHTPKVMTVTGTWSRLDDYGNLTSHYVKLGTQNGFIAAHRTAGTVFVVVTGPHKGYWSKLDSHF